MRGLSRPFFRSPRGDAGEVTFGFVTGVPSLSLSEIDRSCARKVRRGWHTVFGAP